MHKKIVLLLGFLYSFSVFSSSDQNCLVYTVTNQSQAKISFKSTDLFDFGKIVTRGQSKTITYDFPPKIMITKIHSFTTDEFSIITDASCDELGLPPSRQERHFSNNETLEGMAIQKAGRVHVTIQDLPGSTPNNIMLTCLIEKE